MLNDMVSMKKEHSNRTYTAAPAMRNSPKLRRTMGGFGLMEAIMAMGLIMLIALSTTQTFLASNRIAASNRVLTAARTIVQRNLDMAMSQRFDGSSVPPNLVITGNGGATADDDGGSDGQVNILVEKKAGGTTATLVKGTLMRFVTAEPNSVNADIRRITFRLTYQFQRRTVIVEMTGLRAIDD